MGRFSSVLRRISCCVFKSSSLNPQFGRSVISHKSEDSEVEYCVLSSIPAWTIIFLSKLGFLSEEELASFSLKCVPCFFNDRKCANFAFALGSGEPGGDGGMSRFGTGGSVKSCMRARDVEKGEDGPSEERPLASCGPSGCEGPRTGPTGSAFVVASGIRLLFSNVFGAKRLALGNLKL